jgi:hypothetical protein
MSNVQARTPDIAALAGAIGDSTMYERSISATPEASCFLGRRRGAKFLGVVSADPAVLDRFAGASAPATVNGQQSTLKTGDLSAANAAVLRELLPFLVPRTLGLALSAGCGDRLGLATPGHVRAFRRSSIAPILAQQSMRENARTGRTPQEVVDDAMWGVFQEGWREGFGADADHLKTTADIDLCAAAGYTFYTIDSSEHVDNEANTAPVPVLEHKISSVPWALLDTDWSDTKKRLGASVDLGTFRLTVAEHEWLRAAAKYGAVVGHAVKLYRHLRDVMSGRPFELEVSIDESETVTTLAEHVYIANELRRLGVVWVSLAPRYVGEFLKGVDYIGDLGEFERSFGSHLAVARTFGPYKLSLHSGSDKFSVYPIASRVAGTLIHLKTAGTSYLEALRAIAMLAPELFRDIAALARDRYAENRVSYHVTAEVARTPEPATLSDGDLPGLLDHFDARQILHVAFGSVLQDGRLRAALLDTLKANEEVHYDVLERHFAKHLAPFEAARA